MAYVYLIDLHTYVDKRLSEAREILSNNGNDPMTGCFEQGRIAALSDCKSFLTEQFNPRLPRRIRERFSGKKSVQD